MQQQYQSPVNGTSSSLSNDNQSAQNLLSDDQMQLETAKEQQTDKSYVQYSYRWVIMVLYFMPNMCNAAAWITLSPIAVSIEFAYHVDGFTIDLCSMVYMIIYILFNFPSNYILEEWGVKTGIMIGTSFTILGLWMRTLTNYSFSFVIVGQVFGGIAQPFILNLPAKLAANWWIPEHRPLATAVLALINPVGVGIGFLIPGMVVRTSQRTDDDQVAKQIQEQFFNLLFYSAIVMTILMVPVFFLFREKPPTPPSYAANAEKTSFRKSFEVIRHNRNFFILFGAFSCFLGGFNTIGTLINQILEPFKFDNNQCSVMGAFWIVFGLIGGFCAGLYVEKTLRYKMVLGTIAIGYLITTVLLIYTLPVKSFALSIVMIIFAGFLQTPILPIGLDFGCEIGFPLGEAFLSGVLVWGGQLIIIINFVFNLNDKNGGDKARQNRVMNSGSTMVFLAALGGIFTYFLKEDLRRAKKERPDQKHVRECVEEDELNQPETAQI